MAERSKYEQWLRDLEAKKQSTPAHVYERVRGDYTSRLDAVMEQLRDHTASMQSHARTLMARLRELEAAEQDLKDELAEQELRSDVGELTPGEWETISRKAQRAISKVQEDQEAVAADLTHIRNMIEGRTEEDEAEEEEGEPPRRSTDFNELEFLKSVVGPTTPSASSTPAGNATTSRSSAERPAEPPPPAPKRPTPAATAPVAEAPKPTEPAPATPPKPAAPRMQVTSDAPLTLKADDDGTPKTLKCAECGTMNSPNEWYCERCGAELANI